MIPWDFLFNLLKYTLLLLMFTFFIICRRSCFSLIFSINPFFSSGAGVGVGTATSSHFSIGTLVSASYFSTFSSSFFSLCPSIFSLTLSFNDFFFFFFSPSSHSSSLDCI
ncbi:hypothetical protein HanHA300_Chr08g0270191 [Helianthus annuus]|nr:hypothetical protein HanHA300_Chr08g0270191 [Helianthus annuus]KAJ0552603.1 hypothetical protein HanHA89_Chr08g0287041 [Helianthus annuus]KAJ0718298.1 hypothetical protein HanLR1_Chr08g0269061 [Helianthus annuus]KAJ0721532.1 hypothetical protein HanOQP8_Chr08g0276571 [Helianthus annuus]